MKQILIRLLMAAFLTLAAFALSSSARGLQASSLPDAPGSSTRPEHSAATATLREGQIASSAATFSSGEDETQEAFVFTGQIAQANKALVLTDPVTKMTYQLDDQARARRFLGRQVRVIGRLGMKSNTIHIDTINPMR